MLQRRPIDLPVGRRDNIVVNWFTRTRGRPRSTLFELLKKNIILFVSVTEDMVINRTEWKKRIQTAESKKLGEMVSLRIRGTLVTVFYLYENVGSIF